MEEEEEELYGSVVNSGGTAVKRVLFKAPAKKVAKNIGGLISRTPFLCREINDPHWEAYFVSSSNSLSVSDP